MKTNSAIYDSFLACTHCEKQVNGGTHINNVFYCPMCTSIINRNNRDKETIITNSAQQCPYCNKPTKTNSSGVRISTAVYYKPCYDENLVNINPDRNSSTTTYTCLECGRDYDIVTY